jgi:hypothetical protein
VSGIVSVFTTCGPLTTPTAGSRGCRGNPPWPGSGA